MTHDTHPSALRRLLRPQSIAIVGASNDPNRIGGRPLRYLLEYGFQGTIFAVNPKYQEIMGVPCVADVAALPRDIDLGLLMVASAHVLDYAEQCGQRGMGGLVVSAAGFAEDGAEGRKRQDELARIGKAYGMRILGPNTAGVRNQKEGLYATFATDLDSGRRVGRVAIVTQSGGLGGYFGSAQPREHGVGTNYLIDTGNEADVDAADCVRFIAEQEDLDVSVIGLMLEGCSDGRKLLDACLRARERNIPVVMLKIGRSAAGAKAIALHTGSLTGEDRIWDAALAAAGVIRAVDEGQFVDLLRLLDLPRPPKGKGIGVLSLSGGVATLVLDACESLGLDTPPLGAPESDLQAQFPLVHFGNPLDASGQMTNTPDTLDRVLRYVLDGKEVELAVVWLAYALLSPIVGPPMMGAIISAARASTKPVLVLGMATPEARDALFAAGVGLMELPSHAMAAIAAISGLAEQPQLQRPLAPWKSFTGTASQLLTGLAAQAALPGIPFAATTAVMDESAAVRCADSLGYPVVLKVEGEGLAHKSELGLVHVNLADAAAVRAAWVDLRQRIAQHGIAGEVFCQPMKRGVEFFAGMTVDPIFGPVVTFGLGGIFVEVLKDVATLLAPATAAQVEAALHRLRLFPLLDGARGQPRVDLKALSETVARLSRLAIEQPQLLEVDLNPIILLPGESAGVVAVDAVVRLGSAR